MIDHHLVNSSIDGTAIRCTCCGRSKKVGEIHADEECLELVSRHHGTNHVAKVPVKNILESLSGTSSHEGVARWVKSLF
jgi:uncharacterized FAD-dependent dehydrogenase